MLNYDFYMGWIYHAAFENTLIYFMDSRPWNAPLPVFLRLVDTSRDKSWNSNSPYCITNYNAYISSVIQKAATENERRTKNITDSLKSKQGR